MISSPSSPLPAALALFQCQHCDLTMMNWHLFISLPCFYIYYKGVTATQDINDLNQHLQPSTMLKPVNAAKPCVYSSP